MERFFWSLNYVWMEFESFDNITQARLTVFQYIDTYYNSKRIHQTFVCSTVDEFEEQHREKSAVEELISGGYFKSAIVDSQHQKQF